MDFAQTAELCAPNVAAGTLRRIASVESSFNPNAIGVVGGRLARQPASRDEAVATAEALEATGWNYSVGLVQVNHSNFAKYGLTSKTAFDPCANLRVGGQILADCYRRAGGTPSRMGEALSCYYSGNFSTGFRLGYVARVEAVAAAGDVAAKLSPIPVIASLPTRTYRKSATGAVAGERIGPFISAPQAAAVATGGVDQSSTSKASATALLF